MSINLSSQSINPSGSMIFGLKSSTSISISSSCALREERRNTGKAITMVIRCFPLLNEVQYLFSFPRVPRAPRGLKGCPQAFINELLDAFPFVCLAGIDVALRIHGDAADAVELARHSPALAEARDDFKRFAPQDEDLLVMAVGDVEIALLWIVRKCDLPNRPVPESRLRDESFFHKFAVLLKHLDSIVLAVADIDQIILRYRGAAYRAKLFCRGRIRIVRAEARVIGLFAVSAPVPLVCAGVGVEDDDAVIAESVGDVGLVGRRIDSDAGRPVQPRFAIAALDIARASDLRQELPRARELDHVSVLRPRRCRRGASPARGWRRCSLPPSGRRLGQAGGCAPDVPLVIDCACDSRLGAVISLAGTAPVADQRA